MFQHQTPQIEKEMENMQIFDGQETYLLIYKNNWKSWTSNILEKEESKCWN